MLGKKRREPPGSYNFPTVAFEWKRDRLQLIEKKDGAPGELGEAYGGPWCRVRIYAE
jgi:hypothetical protein